MLFRDTYTDGTPMTRQDRRDHTILTLAGIGGVALLLAGVVLLALLAGGNAVVNLSLVTLGAGAFTVIDRRERHHG